MKHAKHAKHVRRRPLLKRIWPAFVAVAVLVSLAVGGTFAYLSNTTNQVANPLTTGDVAVAVVEGDVEYTSHDASGSAVANAATASLTATGKQVALKNVGSVPAYLRVTFIPEVRSVSQGVETDANVFMDQTWPASFTGTELSLGLVTLHFSSSWASDWEYKDGTFYSKQPIEAGMATNTLLMGVTTTSDYDTSKHGTVYVDVIADAIQVSAAASEWGIEASST